ncbi:protein AF-10-like isoform X1 [Scylla paramamosain]|uniref:protein AF-10-like isoform X1 n=1 Tax=Scylla paramamosain TaxID=85552 RepID=UPI0030829A25
MKPKQEDPKEMVGGCCVCSDENGWTENPLVYCDGQGCNVAVHQACYGIVTVPTGAWFCRKCESQERAARVHSGGRRIFSQRCELCPSKDGALKRTDSGGWAHVVCALYIPEVRFGNVTTMEPIMLQLIPQERFNKSCYICEESGKESRAVIGACMQCNKSGCKQHFHVTCAQSMGLLCEEAGNYLDNVKYCGYCQYHFSKLRKGSHVKTIPPYRPVPLEAGTSDDDKTSGSIDSRDPKSKKRTGRPPGVKPTAGREGKIGDIIGAGNSSSGSSGTGEHHDRGPLSEDSASTAPGSSGISLGATSASAVASTIKTERTTKVTEPSLAVSVSQAVATVTKTMASVTVSGFASNTTSSAPPPQTTSLTSTFPTSLSSVSTPFTHTGVSSTAPLLTTSPSLSTTVSSLVSSMPSSLSSSLSSLSSIITTVPSSIMTTASSLTRPRLSETQTPSTTSHESSSQISLSHNHSTSQSHPSLPVEGDKDKDKQQERNRKLRRNGPRTPSGNSNFGDTESIVSNDEAQSNDLVLTICEEKNLSVEKESNKVPSKPLDSSDDGGSLNVQYTPNIGAESVSDPFAPTLADFNTNEPTKRRRSSSQERGRRSKRGMSKRGRPGGGRDTGGRDSGASSPDSFTSESAPAPKRGRKKVDSKESLPSVITNGVGANTLLLGNQLNPSSAVAQKMTDTLHAELEAHSIYKDEDKNSNLLVGPALPGKKENTNGTSLATSNQPPPFPQSLEQLLERQWEQGSQFLMEQAQHFDIASLLSCLHQLRQENVRLEETVSSLISRRDHLLAVNARLSVPLSSPTPTSTSSPVGVNPTPPSVSASSSNSSSSSSSSVPALTTSVPSHTLNPRPSSRGSAPAPLPPRPHSQGHHQSGSNNHTVVPPSSGGGGGHRGASPHDRRGPSPQDRRGTSPHDRRAPPPPVPVENGLGEQEYRYRSPGTEHRQQSPMLPPGAQPSPTSLRHSPAGGNYHPSVSPHGVGSPSPGVPHGHPPTSHGPPPHHSMPSSHGPSGHGPSGQGPPSHGSPHGPPPPPHGAPPHGPPPPMVSVAPNSAHNVAISRQSDHRGEMVRMHSVPPPPPQHPGPNLGSGGYSVYQMVSPVPGPHHSPVPPMSQPHPPPHAQVMRRDLVESGRGASGNMEKR